MGDFSKAYDEMYDDGQLERAELLEVMLVMLGYEIIVIWVGRGYRVFLYIDNDLKIYILFKEKPTIEPISNEVLSKYQSVTEKWNKSFFEIVEQII